MIQLKKLSSIAAIILLASSCKKDVDPIIVVPASTGSQMQLNGLVGNEPGNSAGNSVFVDFSNDKQVSVERKSWDLGFYCGNEFRVIINNTTSATAKVVAKNDLTLVSNADTVGMNGLTLGYDAASMSLVDNVHGDLSRTVIEAVSIDDASNKVYIINRGTGGGTPAKDWYKIRLLRNANNGYTLQYAKLASLSFSNVEVAKDADYNFKYFSFDNGLVSGEPIKTKWDIKWSYTMFEAPLGQEMIPYASSDFVSVNAKGGVTAAEILISGVTYENFAKSDADKILFSNNMDVIGTHWRTASPNPGESGVKNDRFYVVKDPSGNIYKIKFLSFHPDEGGTRGKPQLEYKLVQ